MAARRLVLLAPALAAACSVLPQPAYIERRDWPLTLRRKVALPPRPRGAVLTVRALTAGPGVGRRGVAWLRPDGSLHTDFYNEWAVPPAAGVTADLRRWLAESGLFAAVVAPESGAVSGWTLEGEVTAFLGEPTRGVARVAIALVLLRGDRVAMQRNVMGEARIQGMGAEAVVRAVLGALLVALGETERVVGRGIEA